MGRWTRSSFFVPLVVIIANDRVKNANCNRANEGDFAPLNDVDAKFPQLVVYWMGRDCLAFEIMHILFETLMNLTRMQRRDSTIYILNRMNRVF